MEMRIFGGKIVYSKIFWGKNILASIFWGGLGEEGIFLGYSK